jgi:hypothetical protein
MTGATSASVFIDFLGSLGRTCLQGFSAPGAKIVRIAEEARDSEARNARDALILGIGGAGFP